MNNDYEFAMEEFDLPAEFESEEELRRFRRSPARSFSPRPNAQRFKAPRANAIQSRPRHKPPHLPKFPPIAGRRTYLYAPESPAATEYVRWVQTMLNRALNLQLPVDGMMSVETRSAIRSFQEKYNLPVTGIVGPDTERALQSPDTPAAPEPIAPATPATSAPPPEGENFLDWFGWGDDAQIEDRTAFTPKDKRVAVRDPKTVDALVLHQMAFSRGSDPTRYDKVTAHYAILPDGKIIQLHPISAYLNASNGFNSKSVAVEFAGNFPNIKGKCWEAKKYGCHALTQAQIEAGRKLIKHLIKTNGLTHVLAHRQSSGTRENDPGPDIWYNVGQWAVDNLGLKDGGPGFWIKNKVGPDGKPIPGEWRTWGKK
jgi:N-acetyl-anhydromuramyl-L-alanine amidase AmpD